MKRSNFLNLVLAGVLLAGVAGCKKTPKNITNIPGSRAVAPTDGGPRAAIPPNQTGINLGPSVNSRPVDMGALAEGDDIPTPVEGATHDRTALATQTVFFDFDRSAIRPSEQPKLEIVADYLKTNPNVQLLVEGHCDERGTEEYNRALGERRAIAAREFLIQKHGIESERITTVSFGEDKPLSLEKTEEGYALNRRDEFVILRAQ